ncbi:hypothetical protein ACOME3_003118 [Neoechinorhynchus agilis]
MNSTTDFINISFRQRFSNQDESAPIRVSPDVSVDYLNQLIKSAESKINQSINYTFYHEDLKIQSDLRSLLDQLPDKREQIIMIEYEPERLSDEKDKKLKHQDWVSCVRLLSKSKIISGCFDGYVRIYDKKSLIERSPELLPAAVTQVEVIDNLILCSCEDGLIRAFENDEGFSNERELIHDDAVRCFSVRDHRLISGSDDGSIRLWILKKLEKDSEALLAIKDAHVRGPLMALKWISDTEALSCSYTDRYTKIWSIDSMTCVQKQMMHTSCLSADFSFDDNLIYISLADEFAKALDCRNDLKEAFRLGGHQRWTYRVRVLDKSTRVLTASGRGQVFEWDIRKTNAPLASKFLPKDVIVFDVDGITTNDDNATLVAIASQDKSVRIGPIV